MIVHYYPMFDSSLSRLCTMIVHHWWIQEGSFWSSDDPFMTDDPPLSISVNIIQCMIHYHPSLSVVTVSRSGSEFMNCVTFIFIVSTSAIILHMKYPLFSIILHHDPSLSIIVVLSVSTIIHNYPMSCLANISQYHPVYDPVSSVTISRHNHYTLVWILRY